ncbi:MAG TPA: ABC-type transport auxiliary lipoprotein family protein [Burkholderiales bacterium]|nr:ABC-type transport auxiliary lipoprotein family protein [Burkholderiales bacterium]
MHPRHSPLRSVATLAAGALLAGCAMLQPAPAETANIYLLNALPKVSPQRRVSGKLVLAVSAPRAQPGFDTDQMVYVRRPHEIEHFAHSRWADTPARMLAPLLVRALLRGGGFRAVVQAPGPVEADLQLDTELVRLQQDFSARPSRIELTLRVQLIDLRHGRDLATREFDVVESAPSDNPYGGVLAANRALGRVLGQLAEFCADAAGSR